MHYLTVNGAVNTKTSDGGGGGVVGDKHVSIPCVDGVVPAELVCGGVGNKEGTETDTFFLLININK